MSIRIHESSDEDREDLLARYALGTTEPRERRLLQHHLAEGCAECATRLQALARVGDEIALAAHPIPVAPGLRDRVLASVASLPPPAPGFHFVASDEGAWQNVAPGVQRRRLGRDPLSLSASYLVRVAPGATVPAHEHPAAEHCWVVEGDFVVEGRILRAGDYHRADAGTAHRALRSEGGCVFLVVEARPAEMARG